MRSLTFLYSTFAYSFPKQDVVTLISCKAYVEGRLPCSEYSDCLRVFQKFSRNFPKASINISLNIAIATAHTCFSYVPVEAYANPL